ncbi:MAG: hypothetical protein MAG458_00520 [Nitrosopumilus sp.]|nr:hypothetical protein [Nitrosopumilus sp.]
MTTKNFKIALFAALTVALVIPIAGIHFADAENVAVKDVTKKTDLSVEEQQDLKRVSKIMEKRLHLLAEKQELEKSDPVGNIERIQEINSEVAKIEDEFAEIEKKNNDRYYVAPERQAELAEIRENTDFSGIPIVGMGTDAINKQLSFEILDTPENRANVAEIRNKLHELIPDEESFTIKFRDSPTTFSCTSRHNCDPVIGGASIEAHTSGDCTFGFEATRSGAPGFVTAGHCADGDVGQSVYHPTGNQNPFGTVTAELYYDGTSCDCAFVGASTSDIDEVIYLAAGSTYDPSSTTSASSQSGDYVLMSGDESDLVWGTVVDTDFTAYYGTWPFGTEVNHLVKASSMDITFGDSGAPVTNSAGTSLYGVISGGQSFWDEAYWSPVDRISTHLGATAVL